MSVDMQRISHRSEVHWRESKSRNPNFTDVSTIRSSRKNPRLDFQLMLVRGPGEGLEPGIVLGNRRHRLIGELLDKLDLNTAACLEIG